ncbi:MAG: beta-ketoacyl-[acyl-carrier-protein] synthase family protein [Deltaproteobacteria bacterium]|nr:beta-ketoacyl-[acyl-carrier-protein] synthase family protein [Deltaproteobacteria bacterium]
MENAKKRIVITGMAINTPLGDTLDAYFDNLIAGKSAIRHWICVDTSGVYSKVGGDLSDYDFETKLATLAGAMPEDVHKRLRKLVRRAPFSTKLSLLCAADAYLDAGLHGSVDPTRHAVVVGGHNLNKLYLHENYVQFVEEPDFIDSMASMLSLDTDHAASVAEMLGIHGAIYTVGGACASGNVALRNAVDEIRYHDYDVALVVGAALEYAPMDLHAMCLMGAISFQSFNDEPSKASRPYDTRREGFVPSHGSGALVVESLDHARARGARIHAEVLGVTAMSDGCHLPTPSMEGQARTMTRLLKQAGVRPEEIDFVSAHATSTPLGDLSELSAIKRVFGEHARKLKINAPKSMLGHTCWSAPTVETVAAIMQMKRGFLHPSINIENLDPGVDLDVCANRPVRHEVRCFLKNSFGFGGINCCCIMRRPEA